MIAVHLIHKGYEYTRLQGMGETESAPMTPKSQLLAVIDYNYFPSTSQPTDSHMP